MADTSAHNEEMEYFVGAETLVLGIEYRKLQCIDDAAYGIDDSACQKPKESSMRKRVEELSEYKQAHPAHGNIDDGGEPFWTGNPECLD